jgi:hypothetical protein
MTDDIVLLHYKLDLILDLLLRSNPKLVDTLQVLPFGTAGSTNSSCPVCKEAVRIAIYPSSGEIKRECRCNKDLGVQSVGPLPALPQPWAKKATIDD